MTTQVKSSWRCLNHGFSEATD